MTREYELTVIFSPAVREDGLKAAERAVESLVAKVKGKVVSVSEEGKRSLAYPIGKFREGFYVFWSLSLPTEATAKFEAGLKLQKGVLRQLLIKL